MPSITIPNGWSPREYQKPLYNSFGHGKQFQRASVIWHRRAGKDTTVLNLTAREMFKRVGTYWHLFPEQTQARRAIWNGIDSEGHRIIEKVFPNEVCARSSNQEMLKELHNGSIWQMAGSDNYNSLVGSNPVGVVFSEFALSQPEAWDYIRPILLENGGWAVFITTPRGQNHAYTVHTAAQGDEKWFDQILTYKDTGVLTEEDIEQERREGMSEAKIEQEYMCSFDAAVEDQLIPAPIVRAGREAEPFADTTDALVMGVDVGRQGGDDSCIFYRRGLDARSIPYETFNGLNTMQLAAHVARAIDTYAPEAVYIDETGIGAGVVDRLMQLNYDIVGVQFGAEPDFMENGPKVANKRAEMYVSGRDWLSRGGALPDDDRLALELQSIHYSYDNKDAILLEPKKKMKKSPDVADAFVLTFAYPVVSKLIERDHYERNQTIDSYSPYNL